MRCTTVIMLFGASALSAVASELRAQDSVPPPIDRPTPAPFEPSAPGEIVTEATRTTREALVGDMLRQGMVIAVQQGPPGILRTAVGEPFHTLGSREFYYRRLASAYYSWTNETGPLVIELWDRGRKIGEYSEGVFMIDESHSKPRDCTGPGLAGICGPPMPVAAAKPSPAPAAAKPDAPRGRGGWHLGLGLGGGSTLLWCGGCDFSRETAPSGYLSVAGTVAKNMLLGVEGTGWTGEVETGSTAQVYSLMAVVTGYLNQHSGLFLRTGLGLVGYRDDADFGDIRGNGFGFSARLGYELGRGSVRLVPYVGYVGTFGYPNFTLDDRDYAELAISNIQFGLALGIQ